MNPLPAILALADPAAKAPAGDSTLLTISFWLFAALAVLPAVGVLLAKDVVRAAFLLLGSLAGVAGLYGCLGADFIAFTQVVVYIGGILILLLFGVMLTSRDPIRIDREATHALVLPGAFAALVLLGASLYVAQHGPFPEGKAPVAATSRELGELLMTRFAMPFEVVSILLLVALVGAAGIARRKEAPLEGEPASLVPEGGHAPSLPARQSPAGPLPPRERGSAPLPALAAPGPSPRGEARP